MKFRKYGFVPSSWETLKAQIEQTIESPEGNQTSWNPELVTALVELGHICEQWGVDEEGNPFCEATSPLYAVDILWANEPLEDFSEFVVWPAPVGVHVFAGWESQYAIDYCEANPEAEYCQPPLPPTEL
jgi:hypothetical protein